MTFRKRVYKAIQWDIIIKNLQQKSKLNGGTLKNLPNQKISILTPYVYHFSFRNKTLVKVLFTHRGTFCKPAYKDNRKTQTLMTRNSKTSEDRCTMKNKKCLNFGAFWILASVFLVDSKNYAVSHLLTNIKTHYIKTILEVYCKLTAMKTPWKNLKIAKAIIFGLKEIPVDKRADRPRHPIRVGLLPK